MSIWCVSCCHHCCVRILWDCWLQWLAPCTYARVRPSNSNWHNNRRTQVIVFVVESAWDNDTVRSVCFKKIAMLLARLCALAHALRTFLPFYFTFVLCLLWSLFVWKALYFIVQCPSCVTTRKKTFFYFSSHTNALAQNFWSFQPRAEGAFYNYLFVAARMPGRSF